MVSTVTLALALLFFLLFLVSIIKYRFRIKGSTVGKQLTERKTDGLLPHQFLLHLPTVRSQTVIERLYYFIKQSLPLLNNAITPYIENKFASWTLPGRANYPLHFVQSAKEFLREIILIIELLWVSNLTLESTWKLKYLSHLRDLKGITTVPEVKNPSNGMKNICKDIINGPFIRINNWIFSWRNHFN